MGVVVVINSDEELATLCVEDSCDGLYIEVFFLHKIGCVGGYYVERIYGYYFNGVSKV